MWGWGWGAGMPAKRSHLEERARDPARTAGPRVKGGEVVSAGCEGGKEPGSFGGGGLSLARPASADL